MAVPIRGTQSFVGVMGEVWRRPSLTALEVAWRWLGGGLILVPVLIRDRSSMEAQWELLRYEAIIAFHHGYVMSVRWDILVPVLIALLLFWNLIAAFGRTLVLRRFDGTLHPRRLSLFLLGALRALSLAAAWVLWFWLLAYAAHTTITAPAARNEDPHLVVFSAMLIAGTLFLYVAWGVFSWFLQLAPLLAMRENLGAWAALRAALGSSKELRSKLVEINLVMHIVRLCLIVLAMVFSATPLPFADVTTPTFLFCWWTAVVLVYLAFSDYFHVVRAAAYLSLHRTLAHSLRARSS